MNARLLRTLLAVLVPAAAALALASCETVVAKDSSKRKAGDGKPRGAQRNDYQRLFRGY